MHTKHRSQNDKYNMIVFTDASKYPGQNPTGSIVYRLFTPGYNDIGLKKKHYCFSNIPVWEAEAKLIIKGLELFKNSCGGVDNIVFFCDSVRALRSMKRNIEYLNLKRYFANQGVNIILKKVKAHSNSKLNNIADEEAKKAFVIKSEKRKSNGLIYIK